MNEARRLAPFGHAIQFQPVIDQLETQLLGNTALELFDIFIAKFDHAAGGHVDEMIVMGFGYLFIARAAIAEVMTLQDAGILEQLDCTIYGRNRNMRIDGRGTTIQFFRIGMVGSVRQHAGDDTPLVGHSQTLIDAGFLDPRHEMLLDVGHAPPKVPAVGTPAG